MRDETARRCLRASRLALTGFIPFPSTFAVFDGVSVVDLAQAATAGT